MIEIKNISKKYKQKTVVDNISMNIRKGKITSFIGPNGAGKSTVLSMITNLIGRDSGEIYIDNKRIDDYTIEELSQKVAILKQSNSFNVRLTVKEIVEFGRFPYSKGKLNAEDKELVNNALKYMNLIEIKDKYLDNLSGGQRQRALIAMILAQNTEYIFLDEPLNNLDIKHSVEMMKILKKFAKEYGKTIVIVIHDVNFASYYSDDIAVFKNGKLIIKDEAKNVITKQNLENIYEIDFDVKNINNKNICLYY